MIFSRQLFLFLVLTFTLSANSLAQTEHHKSLLKGDRFYDSGEFQLAEENYRKARESEKDIKSTFNLGNAVYQQDRFEEAVDHFTSAAQLAPDNMQRSNAYFNLGNSLFKNQKIEEAIDSYKEAIQLNPDNQEAKYNLLVCKKALRDAQQQEQQQQQNQEQQDQENQEQQNGEQGEQSDEQQGDPEDQEQQDQENQEQQEQQDSTDQNSDIQENAAFDTTRLDKQTLDSLDAMKLLQVIENEEKKVQEKLKKFNSNRKKPDKDW